MMTPKIVKSNKNQIVAVTSITSLIINITYTSMNVVLPILAEHYNISISEASLISLVYTMFNCALALPFGRLGDKVGHKKIYLIGIQLFTLGSFLTIFFSQTFFALLLWRAIQSCGSAMLQACVQAVLRTSFDRSERGKYVGFNSTIVAIAVAAGPSVGGILADLLGWRSLFVILIPLAILSLIISNRYLPDNNGTGEKDDMKGNITFVVSIVSLLVFFNSAPKYGYKSPIIYIIFSIFLVSFYIFIRVEAEYPHPLIRLDFFKIHDFKMGNIMLFTGYVGVTISNVSLPFFLKTIMGFSTLLTSVIFLAYPIMVIFLSPVFGHMSSKRGSHKITLFGLLFMITAMLTYSFLTEFSPVVLPITGLVLTGLGTSMILAPNNNRIISSLSEKFAGLAAGMASTVRSTGQTMAVTVFNVVINLSTSFYSTTMVDKVEIYVKSQRNLMLFTAAYLLSITLVAVYDCSVSINLSKRVSQNFYRP